MNFTENTIAKILSEILFFSVVHALVSRGESVHSAIREARNAVSYAGRGE